VQGIGFAKLDCFSDWIVLHFSVVYTHRVLLCLSFDSDHEILEVCFHKSATLSPSLTCFTEYRAPFHEEMPIT
jgi:hypothetical protein